MVAAAQDDMVAMVQNDMVAMVQDDMVARFRMPWFRMTMLS